MLPKKKYMQIIMLATIACMTQQAWSATGGAYAPVLKKLPAKPGSIAAQMDALAAQMRSVTKQMGEKTDIRLPTVEEVGVKPYPGAKIKSNATRLKSSNGTYIHLPQLQLLTKDSPQRVAAFYHAQLAGWHYHKEKTVLTGQGEWWFAGPDIKLHNGSLEHDGVTIDFADKNDRERFMPGAKCRITIDYVPPGMIKAKDPDKYDFPPYVK